MSKIEQNRQRKKQAILSSARESFLLEGYVATSVDEIASRAQITKQTLYRYFASKQELFEATLHDIASQHDQSYVEALQQNDVRMALVSFAEGFVQFHLSTEHLATYRLLVNESVQAPEMVQSFFEVGPDSTEQVLADFMQQHFPQHVDKTELWLAMLLAPRNGALLGMQNLNEQQIKQHAEKATDFFLAALSA
ncbi:TetR/AcrR family transcriptional regulator [Vibrio fluminensis]|uniref:TetR/AcrR family transcriptional regulator n=1 Tax=Vibrio fluminensis TaxID=2783614 RepID=UPI0018886E06|nr:TetR/AcrR family transcriptional regulator [Vibrio fluminensis]